jgi:hypothetical protein
MTFPWPRTEAPIQADHHVTNTWQAGFENAPGSDICDVIEDDHEVWEQDCDESAVPGTVLADESSSDDQTDDDELL